MASLFIDYDRNLLTMTGMGTGTGQVSFLLENLRRDAVVSVDKLVAYRHAMSRKTWHA